MARLVRWTPVNTPAQRTFDRFFEDFWKTANQATRPGFATPALDVINFEDHVEVVADLPGVSPENVNIEVKDGILTISTQINSDETHESGNYSYRERYQGSYQRSLRVPDTLDTANAEASFENGVLTLRIPRRPEDQPLRIAVKNGASNGNNN